MRCRVEIMAGNQLAATEDVQAIGQLIDFRQIRRDHDDAGAITKQLGKQTIDLGLGSDIDTDRRLIEDEELGAVAEYPSATGCADRARP